MNKQKAIAYAREVKDMIDDVDFAAKMSYLEWNHERLGDLYREVSYLKTLAREVLEQIKEDRDL